MIRGITEFDGAHVLVRVGGDDGDVVRRVVTAAGGMPSQDASAADIVVVDEWTAEHDPFVLAQVDRGARVTNLAEQILASASGPVVAITGTAGKTSTCRALEHVLRAIGRPVAISHSARSGNAWPDASLAGAPIGADTVLIAELTSTHLCHMHIPRGPDVAVVTLIRPDHADLHPSYEAYVAAKRRITSAQTPGDSVVVPLDDPETIAALGPLTARQWGFGDGDAHVPGAFGVGPDQALLRDPADTEVQATLPPLTRVAQRAVLAAAAAALALGTPVHEVAATLVGISAPPHRQHLVGRFRDAYVVDDTMAATPRKFLAALAAFADRRPVLVLGGDSNPHPPAEVTAALTRVRDLGLDVVTFGPMADVVASGLGVVTTAPTVMGALGTAATLAGPEGLVLVSPMFPMDPAERDRVAALGAP